MVHCKPHYIGHASGEALHIYLAVVTPSRWPTIVTLALHDNLLVRPDQQQKANAKDSYTYIQHSPASLSSALRLISCNTSKSDTSMHIALTLYTHIRLCYTCSTEHSRIMQQYSDLMMAPIPPHLKVSC